MERKTFDSSSFEKIFTKFCVYTTNKFINSYGGTYKKMDYLIWKKLRSYFDASGLHGYIVKNDLLDTTIYLDVKNSFAETIESFMFDAGDGSFGTFLFDECFNKKELLKDISSVKWNEDILSSGVIKSEHSSALPVFTDNVKYSTITSPTISTTDSLNYRLEKIEKEVFTDKENKNMNNKFFEFDFGRIQNDKIRMSMYGMAIQNAAGVYVAYNPSTKEIVNVEAMNFDGNDFMFKIPVALNAVAPGDVVIHNRKPMFVNEVQDNKLSVVDIFAGEDKSIIPTTNMFGFNFITKVVSFLDFGSANAENPFGNMLPFLMMNKEDSKMSSSEMFMMMSLMNGNQNAMNQNSMMMMLPLMFQKDGSGDNDMLMAMAMAMNFMPKAQTQTHVTED